MNYAVRFYSLTGPFATVRTEVFDSESAAIKKATNYALAGGYTSVKLVSDDDFTTRVTATTPQGRAGRNIAAIEPDGDFS